MRPVIPALFAAVALPGCLGEGGDPPPDRQPQAAGAVRVAGVDLYPIPAAVAEVCRAMQERTEKQVLCPHRLPRPVRDLAGSTALPPPVLTAFPWGEDGIDFSYSAEAGRPRLDRPERFFHLQVRGQDERLPPGTRPDGLGGKPGLLAPATSLGYASESYFANHWRFFWSEDGADWAATLHHFGPRTKPLLDRLIRDLRPAASLRVRRGGPAGVRTIDVPVPGPVAIAVRDGRVWVAGQGDRTRSASWLVHLDAATGLPAGDPTRLVGGGGMSALLPDEDGVWVARRGAPGSPGLQRLEGDPPLPVATLDLRDPMVALARAGGSLWLVDYGDWPAGRHRGSVLDPGRDLRVPVGRAPAAIAAAAGDLWVSNNLDGTVTRIDPHAGRAEATIAVGRGPVGVAGGHGAVWVANTEEGTVSRIDPDANRVRATIEVGRGPRGLAVAEDGVWVANSLDDTVSRIDPGTNGVTETFAVGAGPTAVAVGAQAVWVANNHDGTVTRIER
jgi:YVTN family beta-propeller protein